MKKKLDKIFCVAGTGKCKVYQAKGRKRAKKSWWQQIYSLFF